MIRGNRRIKQKGIILKLEAFEERVGHIINPLGFRKVCTRWMPRRLTGEVNADKSQNLKGISWLFWSELFLHRILTGDETWVHHCDAENKRQLMEHRHTGSPAPDEFRTKASARRAVLTAFWNYEGVALTDFLETGAIVNSTLHWNPTMSQKINQEERGRQWWFLASTRPQLMPLHVSGLHCYHIQPRSRF
jgi:hypothetical protein